MRGTAPVYARRCSRSCATPLPFPTEYARHRYRYCVVVAEPRSRRGIRKEPSLPNMRDRHRGHGAPSVLPIMRSTARAKATVYAWMPWLPIMRDQAAEMGDLYARPMIGSTTDYA